MLCSFWRIPFHTRKSIVPARSHISRWHRILPPCQSIHPYLPCKSERFSSLASMQNWLRHQQGGRFIVLGQKYGCPDSLSQNSQNLTVVTEKTYGSGRSIVAERLFLYSFVVKLYLVVMFLRPRKSRSFFLNLFPDTLSS